MPLEALPPELLIIILRYVGASELRKLTDYGLTVCKWWYHLVEPLLLEDLTLSGPQLVEISRHSIGVLRLSTRQLTIDVNITKGDEVLALYDVVRPWETVLAHSLNEFNTWIEKCLCLRSLTFRIQHDMSPEEVTIHENLSEWRQTHFGDGIWAPKLSHLKIDTLGAWLEADELFCSDLARRIPSLRSVWLQLHRICPKVLWFGDYLAVGRCRRNPPPKIEKIVISLSMVKDDSDIALFSSHCESEVEEPDALELWKTRAKEAIQLFPRIGEMWLIHHEKDAGNSPELIAREFVSNICREFERDQYDRDSFDPTDGYWDFLDTDVIEDEDESEDEDEDEDGDD